MKTCTKCHLQFPETTENFSIDRKGHNGLSSHCKTCRRIYNTARQRLVDATPEGKVRKAVNARNYYQRHAAEVKARVTVWQKANPEKMRQYGRHYKATHPEAIQRHAKAWNDRIRGTAIRRAHTAVRTAIKKGILIRPGECQRCGQTDRRIEAAHSDYDKPLEVEWLCPSCHATWDHLLPKAALDRVQASESA